MISTLLAMPIIGLLVLVPVDYLFAAAQQGNQNNGSQGTGNPNSGNNGNAGQNGNAQSNKPGGNGATTVAPPQTNPPTAITPSTPLDGPDTRGGVGNSFCERWSNDYYCK